MVDKLYLITYTTIPFISARFTDSIEDYLLPLSLVMYKRQFIMASTYRTSKSCLWARLVYECTYLGMHICSTLLR